MYEPHIIKPKLQH